MSLFARTVAGISFAGETLRTAVLQLRKDGPVLCHLGEERVEDRSGLWFLRGLLRPGFGPLRKVSAVSVGVDNGSVFYHSFPLEQGAGKAERDEMIDWELSHYIDEYSPREFVKDVHLLAPGPGGGASSILVVAANRSFVRGIQEAVRGRNLELQVVETNFFGAAYALGANYPETALKRVLAAVVEGARVDAGVLARGKLERHACAHFEDTDGLLSFLAGAFGADRIDETYLGGAGATHALVAAARARLPGPVEMLNPVRNLRLRRRYARRSEFAGVEHRFASVIGCALRRQ